MNPVALTPTANTQPVTIQQPTDDLLKTGVDATQNDSRLQAGARPIVQDVSNDLPITQQNIYQKFLEPLTEFRHGFDRIMGNISTIVSKGNMGMKELLQIQFQLVQLAYMNDISSKTADKLSQGVQTLFRNQG